MKLCDSGCHAICDFCKYCGKGYSDGFIDYAVCTKHNIETDVGSSCIDFHCFNVKDGDTNDKT